jgi:hypothetical protein
MTEATEVMVRMYGKLIDPTGQPAAGIGIVIIHKTEKVKKTDKAEKTDKVKTTLSSTVSDSNGAFFITFARPLEKSGGYEVQLSVNEKPIPLADLGELQDKLYGPLTLVVERQPPEGMTAVASRAQFLMSEEEQISAYKKAPGLFTKPIPARKPDPCNPYAPVDVPSRVFYLQQLALFPGTANNPDLSHVDPLPDFANPAISIPNKTRYGAILEFRQEWWDFGQSLGNLLYSVPLAPCEETKIATVDWRRRDFAKRQTALNEEHFQDTTITRDETVNEAVRMASDKHISGTTEAGGFGISIGPLSGGYSATGSNVTEVVDASTTASRQLNDRIRQVSNTMRNTRAFAIAEATQEEESVVRTRVLRNHNHCHTITFQYYEVLQIYLLSTRVNQIRPAIFVPFNLMSFTRESLWLYGYLLRRALLDTTLEPVFDRLLGLIEPAKETPMALPEPAKPGGQQADPDVKEFRVSAVVTSYDTNPGSITSGDRVALVIDEDSTYFNASQMEDQGGAGIIVTFQTNRKLSSIQKIGLQNDSVKFDLFLDDFVIEVNLGTAAEPKWQEFFFKPSVEVKANRRFVEKLAQKIVPSTAITPVTTEVAEPISEREYIRLLGHLNANPAYYTGAIISGGDAGLRYMVLAGLTDSKGNVLADIVDNTVAGFVGNYVAFPLKGMEHLPESYRENIDVKQLVEPGNPHERLITLPTPGVFAESQLGQCSSCEKIDNTRFWDWQQSPCPDEAPDITADMLASRYQNLKDLVDVIKSDLLPKDVQIPTRPEPMITIGDETLKELVKGLNLPDAKGVLDFISGLSKISSDHSLEVFKTIWTAFTGKPVTPEGGDDKKTKGEGAKVEASLAPTEAVPL